MDSILASFGRKVAVMRSSTRSEREAQQNFPAVARREAPSCASCYRLMAAGFFRRNKVKNWKH